MNQPLICCEQGTTMETGREPAGVRQPQSLGHVSDLHDRKDRELLDRIAVGSEDAFVELYRRYAPAAMGVAVRVLGEQGLAEDVLQEVFASIWRSARSYDSARGRVRSWLLAQIHHRAVDSVRREEAHRRRNNDSPLPADPTSDIVEEGWIQWRRAQVRAALEALSDKHREVLSLAYYAGLTQNEIAGRTGLPLGTVKTRTLHGMRRLRDLIPRGEP